MGERAGKGSGLESMGLAMAEPVFEGGMEA